MNSVLFCLPIMFLIASIIYSIRAVKSGKKKQSALATQLLCFLAVCIVTFAVPVVASATSASGNQPAGQTPTSQTSGSSDNGKGLGLIAAALVTGLAGFGGGIAVAAAAPAAIGATSEDPKSFGKALIFVALGEGIALYGLLISILILNKI